MSDELLPYYNRELSFIRHMAAEFATANPKIAGRLRLGSDSSEDPHVERLIQAFAYLNARTRHKIDDDFPELTDAILGALYPHFLAPVPSVSVVQFSMDRGQADQAKGYTVPARSAMETEPIQGNPCRFRTCYPATVYPIELQSALWTRPPFHAPYKPTSQETIALLKIVLQCWSRNLNFANFPMDRLRFFLRGQPQHVYALYELLLNNVIQIALASSPNDPAPIILPAQNLVQVGFARDEYLLPQTPQAFLGYRYLSEFFTFPEKFLFIDLVGLNLQRLKLAGRNLEIYFFLNRNNEDLEQTLSADMFCLGCTPVVNLFEQRAEPIVLTQTDWEYRVVPDSRRPLATEIYSIDRVTATSPDGEKKEYIPFYSVHHADHSSSKQPYWFATRKPAGQSAGKVDHGTEIYLSLVDLDFTPASRAKWSLDIETTCLNRDLPHRLPFGGGQPKLQLTKGNALISRIECLLHPTPTIRPPRKHGALWRLLSHLTLNHFSITNEGGEGAAALREILKLYNMVDSDETQALIEGVLQVSSKRAVSRIAGMQPGEVTGGFCRGTEISIVFDEERFAGSGLFLFASVLERFLALYGSLNSFTALTAKIKGREGVLRRWKPRAGERVLV